MTSIKTEDVEAVSKALARVVDGHEHNWREYDAEARAALSATPIERLREENARVVTLAKALVSKLDECAPHVANLSAMNYVRSGVQYTGPSYGEALEELRAALTPSVDDELLQ